MFKHSYTYAPHEHLVSSTDLRNRIERRAFERYLDRLRTGQLGTPADDWFCAEAEVYAELGRVPPHIGCTHPKD